MDAAQALADLTEISSQIQAAVVFDEQGKVAGSTMSDSGRAEELVRLASELLFVAEGLRSGKSALTQLEVATGDGSVFVVRDAATAIVATTGANPTVGLVFYDLKSALRSIAAKPAPTRKAPARKKAAAAPKKSAAAPKKTTAARKTSTRKKPDAS